MKLAVVVGTRPEIIKVAPLIKELERQDVDFFIIHSNQHYSADMDAIFFEELKLPAPKYNLGVGSGTHSNQTGNILIRMEPVLKDESPDILIAQGDTNTVLASGLAASKLGIKVAHLEAGLRSYDRMMPEETNRVIFDHLSDYLFAVTDVQKNILESEGISPEKIHVVGNTVVDAVKIFSTTSESDSPEVKEILNRNYFLATIHRSSNVDHEHPLNEVVKLLDEVSKKFQTEVIWPIHPRARKKLEEFKIEVPPTITLIDPKGYTDFVLLQSNSKAILTDSGGLQEEACILGIPCITVRENTERPETVEVGANILVGRSPNKAIEALQTLLTKKTKWENPFGDGQTSQRVVSTLIDSVKSAPRSETLPNSLSELKISVLGMGYMGLPMASLLARRGFQVIGIDVDKNKVTSLVNGECPLEENGLQNLLSEARKKKIQFSTKVIKSDVYIVAVPTPVKNKTCDLSYVTAACKSIAEVAPDNSLVIIESTISPGTCREVLEPLFLERNKKVQIAHCPERAIPGNSLHELVHNDRVIGGLTKEASDLANQIYSSFVKGKCFITTAETAECAKLLENTFRDINIAAANEFDHLLRGLGVDPIEAISLANRHPRVNILTPGIGVGGHCIAIDPWFLLEKGNDLGLIRKSREINDLRPKEITQRLLKKLGDKKKVGLLGVTYKPNVDDIRETPVSTIAKELMKNGKEVMAFDPHYFGEFHVDMVRSIEELENWADECVILVEHSEFKKSRHKSFSDF